MLDEEAIEGYASSTSVPQGGVINFNISTDASKYNIEIYRIGEKDLLMKRIKDLPGMLQEMPPDSYMKGCGWKVSYKLKVPENWKSGFYIAKLITKKGGNRAIIFVVRQKDPGVNSKIAVVLPFNTFQAYNNYGGKSIYSHNSTNSIKAHKVSFKRPYAGSGTGKFYLRINTFMAWLEKAGYKAEYISTVDLDSTPQLLDNYNLVLFLGHSEYWSKEMRDNMEFFIYNGGSVGFLTGNTCWWQIRLEDDKSSLVCYKDYKLDPLLGRDNARVTNRWHQFPLFRSACSLVGEAFEYGSILGYLNRRRESFPSRENDDGFTIINSDHWLFGGTGLKDGDLLGTKSGLLAYETDGAKLIWEGEKPVVSFDTGTPLSYMLLGYHKEEGRNLGTMGIYSRNGGIVFAAGAINWCRALGYNKDVQKITKNFIETALALYHNR